MKLARETVDTHTLTHSLYGLKAVLQSRRTRRRALQLVLDDFVGTDAEYITVLRYAIGADTNKASAIAAAKAHARRMGRSPTPELEAIEKLY